MKANLFILSVIWILIPMSICCNKNGNGDKKSNLAKSKIDGNLKGNFVNIPCTKENCSETLFVGSDSGAWLQTTPGDNSGIKIIKLPFNTELRSISYAQVEEGENGSFPHKVNWYKVKADGNEGWIKSTSIMSEKHVYNEAFAHFSDTLLQTIKLNKPMSAFLRDSVLFIDHEDNRCDGSTDGQVILKNPKEIDGILRISVFRDGKSWEEKCGKDSGHFNIEFDFHKKLGEVVERADTFLVDHYKSIISASVMLNGFDFFITPINNQFLIFKIKYEDSDPG